MNAIFAGGLSTNLPKPGGEPTTAILKSSLHPAAWSFHAVNVALHAAVTAAYIAVLEGIGVAKWVCLAAGGLFAAHPVHVEAVAGLVGRAELLGALAFCLALSAYIKYLRGRPCGRILINSQDHLSSPCACLDLQLMSPSAEVKFQHDGKRQNKYMGNGLWLWASVGATGVGVMCKEQAVTALGVAIVLHAAVTVLNTARTQVRVLPFYVSMYQL